MVATDSDGQASKRDVIITVTNMDEAGMVTLSAVQPRIGVPITASLTDPDGDISNVTWVWTKDGQAPLMRMTTQKSYLHTGYGRQ